MAPTAPASSDVRLSAIRQIALTVHDLDRSVTFYRDGLGLAFLFQAPPGLAFFQCGEIRLMLSVPEKPEFDHPGSVLYFQVADIVAAHASLVSRGVGFIDQPHIVHRAPNYELWMAFFKDPDGNPLALMCEKPIA